MNIVIPRLSTREQQLVVMLGIYSFIPAFGGLLRILELAGGPGVIPVNERALAAPLPVVIHVLASFIFCMVGIAQFLPGLRRARPAIHRVLGRVIAVAGIIAALTGLWMTVAFAFPAALQGALLYSSRLVLATAMASLIVWGVWQAMTSNVMAHRAAMLRAYAIGQGASTQAVVGIIWIIVTGAEPEGLTRDLLMTGSWVLNLAFVEYLIRSQASGVPFFQTSIARRTP